MNSLTKSVCDIKDELHVSLNINKTKNEVHGMLRGEESTFELGHAETGLKIFYVVTSKGDLAGKPRQAFFW